MVGMIVAIVLTFTLSLALLLLLLGGKSPVAARLTELAAGASVAPPAPSSIDVASRITQWFAPLRKMFGLADDVEVAQRLEAAGYRGAVYVNIYYTVKLLGPVVAALIVGFLIRGQNLFMWFMILGAVGFLGPDFWLTNAVKQRRERIRLALPDALDLLIICMEAGLGMDQALIRIGEELRLAHKDLSDEFLFIRLEQRAGKPRIEAWRNMAASADPAPTSMNVRTPSAYIASIWSRNLTGAAEVLGEPTADRVGLTVVDRRVGVAVHIDTRRGQLELLQKFPQRPHGAARQRAVERGRHREAARGDAGRGQPSVQCSRSRARSPRRRSAAAR